jgi:hypothetical protein
MRDLVAECVDGNRNHGAFVSYVTHLIEFIELKWKELNG